MVLGFPTCSPRQGRTSSSLAALGGATLRVTAGISDSASSLAVDLDGAAPVLPRPIGTYCYIPPPYTQGLELWGSRLSLGLHVSSVLQELACCRTRCTASPFFFCPSEPWLVLPIWFTWLVLVCQRLVSGTEADAPKDHMPRTILNRRARSFTLNVCQH